MTLREERAMERALKRKKQRLVVFFSIFVVIIVAILIALSFYLKKATPDTIDLSGNTTHIELSESEDCYNSFVASAAVLKDYVFKDAALETNVKKELGEAFNSNMVVFLSFSDGQNRAYVVNGTGVTLESAWQSAEAKAGEAVKEKLCVPVYVKADIVNSIEKISSSSLSSRISADSGIYGEYFRKGIAFDSLFDTALLEAEINSNELIDYDITKNFVVDKANTYLKETSGASLSSMPDTVYLFSCRGFIKDTDGCYTLNYAQNNSYGVRESATVDYNYITSTATQVSKYLFDNISSDGKFIYGFYPVIGLPIDEYYISYHAMALSALSQYSQKLDSAGLNEQKLDSAANYLVSQLVSGANDTLYAADVSHGEISAGGNIYSIAALLDYQKVKGDSSYTDTAKKLGDGLLAMVDSSTGKLNHVLYYKSQNGSDLSVKTVQSDRTFDSSAVYVLSRLYGETGDTKYLDAAKNLIEALIKENYTQYGDSWLTKAVYELTKYEKKTEYYNLALRNYTENIDAIETRIISSSQYSELLIDTYNIYRAMQSENITTEIFNSVDYDRLTLAAVKRVNDLLNTVAYPEIAMYFKNPAECIGSSFVRQDGFRIRLDDVSAFIRAYISYSDVYTAVSTDAFSAASKKVNT